MNTALSILCISYSVLLFVWLVPDTSYSKGLFIYLGGVFLTYAVLAWINLDKSTERKWGWIILVFFAVVGILYASADANCLLWTECSQDGRTGH